MIYFYNWEYIKWMKVYKIRNCPIKIKCCPESELLWQRFELLECFLFILHIFLFILNDSVNELKLSVPSLCTCCSFMFSFLLPFNCTQLQFCFDSCKHMCWNDNKNHTSSWSTLVVITNCTDSHYKRAVCVHAHEHNTHCLIFCCFAMILSW